MSNKQVLFLLSILIVGCLLIVGGALLIARMRVASTQNGSGPNSGQIWINYQDPGGHISFKYPQGTFVVTSTSQPSATGSATTTLTASSYTIVFHMAYQDLQKEFAYNATQSGTQVQPIKEVTVGGRKMATVTLTKDNREMMLATTQDLPSWSISASSPSTQTFNSYQSTLDQILKSVIFLK